LIRSEPILLKIAQTRNPGKILFNHEVIDVRNSGETVLVTVKTPHDSAMQYSAQYVIGADGGKFVGGKIGVVMEGQDHLEDKVSVHFKADLSKYWDGKVYLYLFSDRSKEYLHNLQTVHS
jgi:2,4-dichlorophenol 6-monooxygenase